MPNFRNGTASLGTIGDRDAFQFQTAKSDHMPPKFTPEIKIFMVNPHSATFP